MTDAEDEYPWTHLQGIRPPATVCAAMVADFRAGMGIENIGEKHRCALLNVEAAVRDALAADRRVAELTQEYRRITKGEWPRAYNFDKIDAALEAVGLPP